MAQRKCVSICVWLKACWVMFHCWQYQKFCLVVDDEWELVVDTIHISAFNSHCRFFVQENT